MDAGFLGVGNMGRPMAEKLLDAGHGLTVYDISEAAMRPLLERQARRASSPQDLADRCEIVFVLLPTLAAFREVAFGDNGLTKGTAMKLLVNTCTIGVPMWVCQAARLVFKHAMHQGAAQEDITAIVQHIERDAGFALPKTR